MSRSAGADRPPRGLGFALVMAGGLAVLATGVLAGDDTPRGALPPLDPPSNPASEAKVALGRTLFGDVRLSTDKTVACASCHLAPKAFTDGKPVAVGVEGRKGRRNAPTILNAALLPHLFWDGRAPSLEEQARQPFMTRNEMGWTDESALLARVRSLEEYGPLFERAYGDGKVTLQRMARAIAAFERTLVAGDSPFDRWWAGEKDALTADQVRGYRLFIDQANCVQCHPIRQSYAPLTDGDFHNTGAGKGAGKDDTGRMEVTGREEDRGAFKTPTLRNVALTGPYMHDGSLATLEEVIDFYVEGGAENANLSPLIRPLELTEKDRADLLAFLQALTSDDLPKLEECYELLAEGRAREAFEAFLSEIARDPANDAAFLGAARAALELDELDPLVQAELLLRERIALRSSDRSRDALEPARSALFLLGKVCAAVAPHEDAMGLARQEDALIALRRLRDAGAAHGEAASFEARLLEVMGRTDEAVEMLTDFVDTHLAALVARETLGGILYRRGWAAFSVGESGAAARADLRRSAAIFDALLEFRGYDLPDGDLLFRAYAYHWLGDVENARAAYADAISRDAVAEKALTGLRNLLNADLATYRKDLDGLVDLHPESPHVIYFQAYELLLQDRLDEAERGFRLRIQLEDLPTGGPHRYLGRIARLRNERQAALDHYAIALGLSPRDRPLITEYETYVRERSLGSFADVDALLAEYRQFIGAGPDDRIFQIAARNNLAFLLRDVATSFASRGPARIHTFPEGTPEDALRLARTALEIYEEAAALIPEDTEDLPLSERWLYAGVLNDTGLLYHYVKPFQDLERAERYYLRAFHMTDGAYQDAYYYNLQFLYGFELTGRDEDWWELARVAKDAILREDPKSDSGFSPDEFKRTAARRDFERLSAKLRR